MMKLQERFLHAPRQWMGALGDHSAPGLLALLFFFGLNLLPVLMQGQRDSLGNNTDSIYHYLKLLRLRGELAPDASFDMDVRLPTDQRLYRLVSSLSTRSNTPLVRTLQIIWFVYSFGFVVGAYLLGFRITNSAWGAAFIAASGWGFALSIGGHWGWDYSPIVPHDLATAFVPWLILIWLRVRSTIGFILYMASLGILAQVYPTCFVHLAALTFGAQLIREPTRPLFLVAGAAGFVVAIAPLALSWEGRGAVTDEMLPLFRERFSYLAPGSVRQALSEYRMFFMQLLLALGASLLLRGAASPGGWPLIRSLGLVSLLAGVAGQFAVYSPRLAPLFVSRASRFSYIWILLLQARAMVQSPRKLLRFLGVGICLLSLALRPNLAGPAKEILRGINISDAVARCHMQDTPDFRELCEWLRANTGKFDVLMTPPDGRYLFLRAYARRPLVGLEKDLGAVHTPDPRLLEMHVFVKKMKKAYGNRDLETVMREARERGCAVAVFPPEWKTQEGAEFANDAGWVLLLGEGKQHDSVATTPS